MMLDAEKNKRYDEKRKVRQRVGNHVVKGDK
jgi:hypothetical protein